MALNADQIQVPLWAGIVFHGMMALRDDRWRDWILCGVMLGVTVLAKYTVLVLLAALALALLLIPECRKVFRNPKLYAAGAVRALPIIALHAVPEWYEGHALDYAGVQFRIVGVALGPDRIFLGAHPVLRPLWRIDPGRIDRARLAATDRDQADPHRSGAASDLADRRDLPRRDRRA